jgi:protein SCO1/2
MDERTLKENPMMIKRRCHHSPLLAAILTPAIIGYYTQLLASDSEHDMATHPGHVHHHSQTAQASTNPITDPHAAHRQATNQIGYKRTVENYTLPARELTTMQGQQVTLSELLDSEQPVAINFIFTSCTTICPIMSATFAQAQKKLGDEAARIHWISISIDPEYDTPERLRDYAQHFHGNGQWSFLTGSTENIAAVQRAFDVYRGDKMNHTPVTLLRAGRNTPWVRLHGLTSSAELVNEYRQLTASR